MPRQKSNETAVGPQINFVHSPDFKLIYANHVNAHFTPMDISFTLAEALGVEKDGKFLVHVKARLTMSPIEAKIFSKIAQDVVSAYENQCGPIILPAGMPGQQES